MALQYDDLVRAQTANAPQYGQQGQVTNAAVANVIPPAPGGGQLPPLTPPGVQPPAAGNPPTAGGDPLTTFNTRLMEMLTRAQGMSNAPLYNEANRLQTNQVTKSMAPAAQLDISGLAPGDALAARKNASNMYDPAVKNINDRISVNNEAISKFESAIKAAKDFGEDYAKYVKPDDATITAVKQQMAAGFLPSATVIDKVGKYLTSDDWNALAKAKESGTGSKQPASIEEYNFAKEQGFKGTYQEWLDRPSQYKSSSTGSGDGTPKTAGERAQANQSKVLDDAGAALEREKSTSTDRFANPNTYRKFKTDYIKAGGSAAEFLQSYPISVYISKQNQVGDLAVKDTSAKSGGNWWEQ